ncbi:orotidine-5'-phosphate decarboxylase [Halalkalibacillus sediminis]|uniref:Orotidine 5'-phosphate decarboxylase n=1 Tax=Halalkalibacillus sediminis TaxID=2018042 RepID=A0A2I0QW46_9BACI|nr:orotidine-5'-phosphate decarboxylase [Halalkalibacillus sediminis]PKR78562.1 orotidine-5'-phosphate decarboxylase [Halalkalibacillus sediminis]
MHPSIYIALDFPNAEQTLSFVEENELAGSPVKVGMQLFYKEGPYIIEKLKERGHPIFLDLKLHDIPNTVHQAMKSLASLEIDFVNVHAAGGARMIEAAREGLESTSGKRPKLLAVTQLTSTDEMMLKNELLINETLENTIVRYAENSYQHGADGVVCPVHDIRKVKQACGSSFITMTPGIRFKQDEANDQKRIATPTEARNEKADYIVMGRSITNAADSKQAYQQAIKEWNANEK